MLQSVAKCLVSIFLELRRIRTESKINFNSYHCMNDLTWAFMMKIPVKKAEIRNIFK